MRRAQYFNYEKTIKQTAQYFVTNKLTMMKAEYALGIPHSTISWWFIHKLPQIDYDLYKKVRNQICMNYKNKGRKK